jgi:hypothetical protein
MALRREILVRAHPEGGLELMDPLLERRARVQSVDELDATWHEGPVAEALRERLWSARTRPEPRGLEPVEVQACWQQVDALPPEVAPAWRQIEPWRRLAEDRAAGRRRLVLRGFVEPGFAWEIGAASRLETELVQAWREQVEAPLFQHPALRALCGAVLGIELGPEVTANRWRLEPGDRMGPHPDGPRYAATWSLGLCQGWRAVDGGAIAFGTPSPEGFRVLERYLPHHGDLLLFRPGAETWHCVEAPRRTRDTLTGWWLR